MRVCRAIPPPPHPQRLWVVLIIARTHAHTQHQQLLLLKFITFVQLTSTRGSVIRTVVNGRGILGPKCTTTAKSIYRFKLLQQLLHWEWKQLPNFGSCYPKGNIILPTLLLRPIIAEIMRIPRLIPGRYLNPGKFLSLSCHGAPIEKRCRKFHFKTWQQKHLVWREREREREEGKGKRDKIKPSASVAPD